ncbi:unnamed protein product [Ranitomeya imitator]|uniref:Fibrinogen C-terminal domain-containing protein n=1 Tax=Ranitomeya imitator TaxID=111125 RepID=A0ABN9LSV8_9NEOB|nr:unnamed protein product [Ranitomeya imitator]
MPTKLRPIYHAVAHQSRPVTTAYHLPHCSPPVTTVYHPLRFSGGTKHSCRPYSVPSTTPKRFTYLEAAVQSVINLYRNFPKMLSVEYVVRGVPTSLSDISSYTVGSFQLRVDLEDFDNNRAYATYSDFSINGEGDFYRLKLDKFIEGTAGKRSRYTFICHLYVIYCSHNAKKNSGRKL